VNETVPSVTVLIAARPGQAEVKAVAASRALDYPADKLEILVARGRQPSVQRNAALRAARGDLIYFLDDDSAPEAGSLRRAVAHFREPKVQMVGGPNVCPPEAPALEQVFARVLASWLAFGPSRARYAAVGQVRMTSEKELILCNLLARRQAMLELGGFNEALYPNEENALMDELQKRGGKLIYDPQVLVHRRPRSSLGSFARMLMTYGRGRAEQFRVHPTLGSALNFVPPLFCLYLLALPFLLALTPIGGLCLVLLTFYGIAVLAQGLVLVVQSEAERPREPQELGDQGSRGRSPSRVWQSVAAIPLIVLTHVLYGFGFWRGLFTSLKPPDQRPPVEVVLETVRR
jgi:cellulose synthase/poly-beta-1,6-N-acetylglucosamine synthase-like glycosyltransferase